MTNQIEDPQEFIDAKLAEMGFIRGDQLYDRGGGTDDCVVYRGSYVNPLNPEDPVDVAAKITTNASLGSILNPNVGIYHKLKAGEVNTWRQVNHPNIPSYVNSESFPYSFGTLDILLTKYIDAPTIRQRIEKGEEGKLSEKEAGVLLRDITSALKHLHTEIDYPVVVRDIHPSNILLNRHGYITDFSVVRSPFDGRTHKTEIENSGYLPVDAIGVDAEPHHDIVSLGNVVIAGAMAQEIGDIRRDQDVYGYDGVDVRGVPYSPKMKDFLRKMIAPPKERFQTAQEALEGLERILGSSAQIIRPKPREPEPSREVAEVGDGNLPSKYSIRDNDDGTFTIFGPDGIHEYNRGKDVYETVNSMRKKFIRKGNFSKEIIDSMNREMEELTRSYFQHVAQENPVLKPFVDGDQTLPELYDEVKAGKPSFAGLAWNFLKVFVNERVDEGGFGRSISEYKQTREEYKQKVGELEKVVSGAEGALGGVNENAGGYSGGLASGLIGSYLAFGNYLDSKEALLAVALIFGGAKLGSNTQRYFKGRKVKKKLGEMDSWLEEPPKSSKGLESRTEDVRLTKEEKGAIVSRSCLVGIAGGFSSGVLTDILLGPGLGGAVAGAGIFWMGLGNHYSLKKRKLKQKRKDLGLPAKIGGPKEGWSFGPRPKLPVVWEDTLEESPERLKKVLSEFGLKEKRFGRRFASDDGVIKVKYKPCNYVPRGFGALPLARTNIKVRAPTPRIAESVISVIEGLWNPEQETESPRTLEELRKRIREGSVDFPDIDEPIPLKPRKSGFDISDF